MRRFGFGFVLLGAVAAQVLVIASPASAYEVHVSITGAGQVTETTPANLLGSGCATSAANPTGAVGANCYAGSPTGDYGWGWTVRYVATAKPGYRFVRWQSDGSANPVVCDGAGGSSTYTEAACQFATFDNLQLRAVFVDDTAPTMASLNGPNQPVNGPASFSFAAASDPTFAAFECRVAGVHDWQSCSSGRQEDPPTGSYTFEVRAVDTSGNRSTTATWSWTVDKVRPETSLLSGPEGAVPSGAATFTFTSNESATFQCRLDGTPAACGSPKSYVGLPDGQHTFTVAAVDPAGNIDLSPAHRTWTVDTSPPDTTLAGAPAALTNQALTQFTAGSTEPGSTLVCRLDGAQRACNEPFSAAEGEHTFTAAATDVAGNTDPSPASHTWTIDTTAPEVSKRRPSGRKVARNANVIVDFSEAMDERSVEASRRGKPLAVVLKQGRSKVRARVVYRETRGGAFRATLNPTKKLKPRKRYTVVVGPRAKDLAGNPLAGTTWSFRTKR